MSDWQPNTNADTARQRQALLARAREWFRKLQVLGVDTPTMAATTTTDPSIDSIEIPGDDPRYLQTSPEHYMKRLLAAGYPDIYSISRVFRGGECGRRHLPEFTIIEWYRIGFGLHDIIRDTLGFVVHVLDRPDLADAVVYDYVQAFQRFAGLDPLNASVEAIAGAAGADEALLSSLEGDRDALLDLLLTTRVAPQFEQGQLTVLRHYPRSQAALARTCLDNDALADRFEIFLGPLELANGYVELTDAGEQASRMRADIVARKKVGKPGLPLDTHLLAALEAGLPECAGVAVGFERLHMIAAQTEDIRDIVTFA